MFLKLKQSAVSVLLIVLLFGCEKSMETHDITLPPTSVLQVQVSWAVITAPHLRLREEPSENARVIRYLQNGFVLEILSKTRKLETVEEKENYWYQIQVDGLSGWVFGAYLNIFDSRAKAEAASKELTG